LLKQRGVGFSALAENLEKPVIDALGNQSRPGRLSERLVRALRDPHTLAIRWRFLRGGELGRFD
jgi:hypothetical protein